MLLRALKWIYKIILMPEYRLPKMGYQRIFTLSKDQIHFIRFKLFLSNEKVFHYFE